MSLSTPSLILPQTSSGSNKLNEENTASVGASDFKHVNTQSENTRPNIKSAQSSSGFVEEEVNDSFVNSLTLLSIISIC